MQNQSTFSFPSRPEKESPLFLQDDSDQRITLPEDPNQRITPSHERLPENSSYTHRPLPTTGSSTIQELRRAEDYTGSNIPYQCHSSIPQNISVNGLVYHGPLIGHYQTQPRCLPPIQHEPQLDVQNNQQFVAPSPHRMENSRHGLLRRTLPELRSKPVDQQGGSSQPSYPRHMGPHPGPIGLVVSSNENDMQSSAKRKAISQQKKIDIIEFSESTKMSVTKIARHFEMPRGTIYGILKEKKKIVESARPRTKNWRKKCIRNPTRRFEMLEEALSSWCQNLMSQGIRVTGAKIRCQAYEYHRMLSISIPEMSAPCSFSTGWLKGYMKKYGHQKANRGTRPGNIHNWIQSKSQRDLGEYNIEDIYFCDETGMYLNMEPTLYEVKNTDPTASVFLCCSMDGKHRMKPFVLGTQFSQTAGCFGTKEHDGVVLNSNLDYLDGHTLQNWLLDFTRTVHRDTLLIMNETMRSLLCVHGNPLVYLPNVRILFVPKMYNHFLPMDSKVAKEFKIRYYALLFESSKAQDLNQWAEKRLLLRLTQEQKLDLIQESWSQIPCPTIERSSMTFLTNVQFPQGIRPKRVLETETESAENILKGTMSEVPKLISYYKNQDKDTGPSLRMCEQVDRIKRKSSLQI